MFLLFIGLALLLVSTLGSPGQFTLFSFAAAIAVLMASGIIASVFFPRVFGGGGTDVIEKRILGDRFEYHDQVRNFIASMQWYTDSRLLLDDLHALLLNTFGVQAYQIILVDEATRAFSLLRSHPPHDPDDVPPLQRDSSVFRYFRDAKADYFGMNAITPVELSPSAEKDIRKFLLHFAAEFCFPFMFEDEPFGMLLLGPKRNNDPFTATDINLLVTLTKNLGIIINQIRLKNQILQNEEMELLGRMSRGMAHDLNNLLTPIWTLLQLTNEGVPTAELNSELLPVALRNIKAVRSYIRESLFFSEHLRPDFQPCRLDVSLQQAKDLLHSRAGKQGVEIVLDAPAGAVAELDEVLVQRMFSNIIANAIDASPSGATIRVELMQLMKTEARRDWLRVRVTDRGAGIPAQDISHVFTPYFTTKTHGDEGRGFGLGLAICRKIVNLHGGNLTISSEEGRGTTVQVDLPTRQVNHAIPAVAAVA
jgi:signal transduction histidine kinase